MVTRVWLHSLLAGAACVAVACARWPAELRPVGLGPGAGAGVEDVPRIDLARLEARSSPPPTGRRDLFAFGSAPSHAAAAVPTPAPAPTATPAASAGAGPDDASAPGARGAAFNVKYIGSVEDKRGLKVAILLTDKREILAGQAGDLLANRIRIVKIGFESVDIQDVGSDRVRRVPLKGN